MSAKELNRIGVLERLANGEIVAKQASETLGLSIRQVKRLKIRFKEFGLAGLVHKNRGRVSNRQIPKAEIDRVLALIAKKYADFGPTLALEKLKENHGVTLGRETLRLAMIDKGVWKSKKKRCVVVHQQRKRRIREGELVQVDGSPHLWFENRGPYCTLLVFIDDATGKLKHLQFARAETTNDYFRATDAYIRQFGKPLALYTDKHGVFRVNTKRNNMASVDDANGLAQFGRAMQELAITLIFANSPQAKGRVEKANGTLQDRLVKEMRLKGISSLKDGNLYLPEFMESYNQRFSVCALSKQDAHRGLLASENLKDILVKKGKRILSKNLEFSYANKVYQVKVDRPPYSMRHAPVIVLEDTSGNIRAYYKGNKLEFEVAQKLSNLKVADSKELYEEVEKVVKMPWKPAKNHPWRNYSI